jgi:hypothetical protein
LNKILGGGIVALLVVAAAAFWYITPSTPKAPVCTQGICKIDVAVVDCVNGPVTANPDKFPVTAPNNIEWTVVTNGYKFTVAGIHFQDPSQFPDTPGSTGGGKKWKVKDNYTAKGDFKYGVKVYRESDNVECKLNDPLISNQ